MKEQKIGIYSELHTLKSGVIWGEPSVEAYLASACLPPDVSLYFGDMNVLKAREEMTGFATLLRSKGVEVFQARDELAALLPNQNLKKDRVLAEVIEKSAAMQRNHGIQSRGVDEMVEHLIELDIQRFGQDKALGLVKRLCLDEPLPLGNLVFARDQTNVLLGTRFSSSMAMPIRKPEVALYEMVYQEALGLPKPISMPDNETFEGGDAMVHDGVVYVGVGSRTSKGAAVHIYENLRGELESLGYKFAMVQDPNTASKSFKDKMDIMHLDTWAMPVRSGVFIACEEIAAKTRVFLLSSGTQGVKFEDAGSLVDFFVKENQELIPIPLKEQQNWSPNIVNLNSTDVIVTLGNNAVTNQRLVDLGKRVVHANLEAITQGYGGAHCSIGQLYRQNMT